MCKNFFNDSRIRYLRRAYRGDRLVLIYLMLVGLSENDLSLGGIIRNDGTPINVSELSSVLPISESDAKEATELFSLLDLLEIIDGRMFVCYNGLFRKIGS